MTNFVWSAFSIDLNADGVPERLVILGRDQITSANSPTVSESDLRAGIYCDGFAVLTKVDGIWWPVIYQWNDNGEHLQLSRVDCFSCPQLVDDGVDGRDRGVGFFVRRWGWNDAIMNEFGAAVWDASSMCIDDDSRNASWHKIPLISVSWGK